MQVKEISLCINLIRVLNLFILGKKKYLFFVENLLKYYKQTDDL